MRRTVCLLLLACAAGSAQAAPPAWLPRYDLSVDLDVNAHSARCRLVATWTNMRDRPTDQLVFNAHSRYVVPPGEVGLMAKTLEILRVNAGEALGADTPAFDLSRVTLDGRDLSFRFEGDTKTTLVVPLPAAVAPGASVTVALDFVMHLPQKQGRWGQWRGVTQLSNWLPVFAVYDPADPPNSAPGAAPPTYDPCWHPTPFVPWHQPFYNEAGDYRVRVTLPCDQKVACTGSITARHDLGDGRHLVEIEAPAVRDFAFLCSAAYVELQRDVHAVSPVKVRVLCLPGHEFYGNEMLRIADEAITRYSQWFGPYPWPEFTLVEAFFGWNGNECATLVMIDERVFGMPHLAVGYVDYLVSHEICHQWWYNQVGTNGYCETWMDEAMAAFFSHKLLNEKCGKNNKMMAYPKGLEWLPNIRRDDYRNYGMYGTFGRGENGPCVQRMEQYGHVVNLFSLCYDKGARVVGMIEERVGEPAFLDFMRGVVRKYQFRILRVADYRRELEAYTGRSWEEFFQHWLYSKDLSDWAIASVDVQPPPACAGQRCPFRLCKCPDGRLEQGRLTRVVAVVEQRAEVDEPTCVGFALPGQEGYPVRVPLQPGADRYTLDEPPAVVEAVGPHRWRVEVLLPAEPTQVTVDPDQVLVDRDPANNFWRQPFRWRITPLYTFLDETDLTCAYDRWNLTFGPWAYGAAYDDPWYTRALMFGVRGGAYRTQHFNGGVYAAYRTDFNDVVVGADGLVNHWPFARTEVGFNVERRLTIVQPGDNDAVRAVVFGRYIFQYGSSLYLPPMHYAEAFAVYQDNFLPYARSSTATAERPQSMTTAGLHYRVDYLTPYWDPEGGLRLDVQAEGGTVDLGEQGFVAHTHQQGMGKVAGQFSTLKSFPDASGLVAGIPVLDPLAHWLADTRVAVRAYGGAALPTRGEFFTLGGPELFRGFDLTARQGSAVWVGSVEWRVPLAKGLTWDFCDHVLGLRNIYAAAFYDVGDIYTNNRSVGPVAHALGGGLRLDVAWFGFVERTMLRLDIAKAINTDNSAQIWVGVQHPF
jgi:hypothetical protein